MDVWFWWTWAKAQGPLGPVVLVLCGVVAAQARYIMVLHQRHSEIEREARLGLDALMRLLMEKKRNGEHRKEVEAETDRRRHDPGEGRASRPNDPRP